MYNNDLRINDALQIYFSKYHFENGGYHLKWFKIKLGFIYIPLPNIKSRVDTVKIHDIHHLITEYTADFKGETEIAAWEIAIGCGKFPVAWIFNLGSFFIGMFLYPRLLLAAFLRGRKCKTNLYFRTTYNDTLLNKTVGELRKHVGIDLPGKITTKDYLVFVWWCFVALIWHGAVIGIFVFAFCR